MGDFSSAITESNFCVFQSTSITVNDNTVNQGYEFESGTGALIDIDALNALSASVGAHQDVDLTGVVSGNVLKYDGSTWIPDTITDNIAYRKIYSGERNSTATGKLAIGNGSTTATMGCVITEPGKVVAIGVSTAGPATNGQWEVTVNGSSVGATVTHNGQTTVGVLDIDVVAGDYLNASCISNGGGGAHTVVFEVEQSFTLNGFQGAQGIQGPPGNDGTNGIDGIAQVRTGTGVPSPALGNNGDFFLDNSTGNYYTKSGGTWTQQGNLKGPSGSAPEILRIPNTLQSDINSSVTGINYGGFGTPTINDSAHTVTADTITIASTGRYRCYFNIYMEASVQRSNVRFGWFINSAIQGSFTANNYIRSQSGHNESSSSLTDIFDLTAGDTVQIRCQQVAASGTVTTPANQSIIILEKIA